MYMRKLILALGRILKFEWLMQDLRVWTDFISSWSQSDVIFYWFDLIENKRREFFFIFGKL